MMEEVEKFYTTKYPHSGFSVVWNRVECTYGSCLQRIRLANIQELQATN
jgi:hypothetical protein